jgi:hypothetical protein
MSGWLASWGLATAALLASASARAEETAPPELQQSFLRAANAFSGCMTEAVKMGMMARINPETFRSAFQKMCTPEETAFRAEAIRLGMAAGRSQTEAEQEADGNIAESRRTFAADQESYFRTGRVPR